MGEACRDFCAIILHPQGIGNWGDADLLVNDAG